jgi:hypothetical protein
LTGGEVLVILLSAGLGRRLSIHPDPAFLRVGDQVTWQLSFASEAVLESVEWIVYFSEDNPFMPQTKSKTLRQVTKTIGAGDHKGTLYGGRAQHPGDYKYGVRIMDGISRKQLSDDDPRLIVRP